MSLPLVLQDHPLPPVLQKELEESCRVIFQDDPGLESARADVRGIFSFLHEPVDGALLDRFPSARVVSNFGAGYDHVDVEAANARGVPCGHTPGAVAQATADLGVALLLASARNVVEGDRVARAEGFSKIDANWFGVEATGATLGIVGMGSIGTEVARRARAFGMRILYHNRNRRPDEVERELGGAEFAPKLEDLLTASDFVVLCVRMTPETAGMIGAAELRAMRPSATLVNIARGGVVDQAALCAALSRPVGDPEGIRAAALDVTEPEPLPRDHPLLAPKLRSRLIITPHMGSATLATRRKMLRLAVGNLVAGMEGRALPNPCAESSPRAL
jgi:glyoxylate reductase